jgi:predicted small lipoprotein YifL
MPCRAALVIIPALVVFPLVKSMPRILPVLLLAAALAACGQKGPLYMPAKAPTAGAAAQQEKKDDEKKESPSAVPAVQP